MTFLNDVKFAYRSLARSKGLTVTVILTLALGIGANAAIFSLVRGVLLRPLVNRDEDRLIYIRQSAPGLSIENTGFSVPEILDLKSRVTTVFVRQGHYAHDPEIFKKYPPPDLSVDRIGDLLNYGAESFSSMALAAK